MKERQSDGCGTATAAVKNKCQTADCASFFVVFLYRWLPLSVPAAGYRNGTSLNNAGSNGNIWSGSPNESNASNSYNLNFNSSKADWNWNNRNNGQSVRPVAELTTNTD